MTGINLNTFRGLTIEQLRDKYRQIRAAVFATEYGAKFRDSKHFDGFLSHYVQQPTGKRNAELHIARDYLLAACGQLSNALATKIVLPPSDETLAWGGFLGGEIHWNHKSADEVCLKILAA